MSEHSPTNTPHLNKPNNTELLLRDLMKKLQLANSHVENQPLIACEIFTQVISEADQLTAVVPANVLNILQDIQQTAGENLVQAALTATSPDELDAVIPVLSGKMERLNNLLNLGFYLQQHQVSLEIDQALYTAESCAKAAAQQAPENPMVKKLLQLIANE